MYLCVEPKAEKSVKGDSISYSYIAVRKYHEQGNLQKEGIICGLLFQNEQIYHHHKGTCDNRQTWLLKQQLRAHIPSHKQEA